MADGGMSKALTQSLAAPQRWNVAAKSCRCPLRIAIPDPSRPQTPPTSFHTHPVGFQPEQEGLPALEALLQRRKGVDAWSTDDVVTWLREIGLWNERIEREASNPYVARRTPLRDYKRAFRCSRVSANHPVREARRLPQSREVRNVAVQHQGSNMLHKRATVTAMTYQ